MAKAEWGVKRTCLSCGARFYDLQRETITCPACGAPYDLSALHKPRRARATPAPKAATAALADTDAEVDVAAVEDEVELEPLEDEEEVVDPESEEDTEDEDGESAIEDVSELGDDDMTDVIDAEMDEEEGDR